MLMIDLTSKNVDVDYLLNKYSPILKMINYSGDTSQISYLLEVGILHIEKKHKAINADIKTWAIIVVTKLYIANIIDTKSDTELTIDDFISYVDENLVTYIANIAMYVDEYDRDVAFVYEYIDKKIKEKKNE